MPAGNGGYGAHGLSPVPDKTVEVCYQSSSPDSAIRVYTGQVKIRDGVLVIYDDLPGGDFFTIAGIPLTSIRNWAEVPEPAEPE
jgi:hypothetical protein